MQIKNSFDQEMRKKENLMQGGMTTKDLGIQEVMTKIKENITHAFICMHHMILGVAHKYIVSNIKEGGEFNSLQVILGRFSHLPLKVKLEGEKIDGPFNYLTNVLGK